METPNYYSIIPANVRYDKRLKPNEKLLYSEITCLSNKNGVCHASNSYFADLYDASKETISRWVKNLSDCGYIEYKLIYKSGTKQVSARHIKLVTTPIDKNVNTSQQKDQDPIDKKVNTPIDKKVKGNNTSNNNTSNNNKPLTPKKNKVAEITDGMDADKLEVLRLWVNYRKEIKKPIKSESSLSLIVNKFKAKSIQEITYVVNLSIENGWQGLFWDKYSGSGQQKKDISTPNVTKKKVEWNIGSMVGQDLQDMDPIELKKFIREQPEEYSRILNDEANLNR